jgi:rfaE bifunctional protein kinase chain/domain
MSARLSSLIDRFSGQRIAVIGDPVLDCYVYGTTHRISREAPVLIVREDSRESRLGAAANTASNLAALGANASLTALVGGEPAGQDLLRLLAEHAIDTRFLVSSEGVRTVTKTRVLAGAIHTTKQQMIRIDREGTQPSLDEIALLAERARAAIDAATAVIISDYGDGSLTSTYADAARAALQKRKIVVVDSRRTLAAYRGVTAVTPNEPEAAAFLNTEIKSGEDALDAAIRLRDALDVQAVVLTRGKEGMSIAERDRAPVLISAHGGQEAVDVTGAGDTVTAAFTLALAAGATVSEAAMLANRAASITVQYVGAATCTQAELKATLS